MTKFELIEICIKNEVNNDSQGASLKYWKEEYNKLFEHFNNKDCDAMADFLKTRENDND